LNRVRGGHPGNRISIPGRGKKHVFPKVPRVALALTQPPMDAGTYFLREKPPGRAVDRALLPSGSSAPILQAGLSSPIRATSYHLNFPQFVHPIKIWRGVQILKVLGS